jgi:hypothetical protein
LDIAPASNACSGFQTWGQAGEALSFGDAVYYGSDYKWYKADNTDSSKMPAIGVVGHTTGISADDYGSIMFGGSRVRDSSWSWTTGQILYVGTSGAITATKPKGAIVQEIGWASGGYSFVVYPKSSNGPINRAYGITPTVSDWDTDPTNLSNTTDDDWSTVTGQGILTTSAQYENATIKWDLGATYTVKVRMKVAVWTNTGSFGGWLRSSTNDSTWDRTGRWSECLAGNNTSEEIYYCESFIRGRYIRLAIFAATGAQTLNFKVYEFQAIEFPDVSGSN